MKQEVGLQVRDEGTVLVINCQQEEEMVVRPQRSTRRRGSTEDMTKDTLEGLSGLKLSEVTCTQTDEKGGTDDQRDGMSADEDDEKEASKRGRDDQAESPAWAKMMRKEIMQCVNKRTSSMLGELDEHKSKQRKLERKLWTMMRDFDK